MRKLFFKGRRAQKEVASAPDTLLDFPNMRDHEAIQRFFLQELQLGEELLTAGDWKKGVDHLCNAVAVYRYPNDLLQVLQQALQPHVFRLLIDRLPHVLQFRSVKQMEDDSEDSLVVRFY
ncbi:mitochondrial import receptor subunit TOM20 homolog B-like [Onthophagus taurus]|uniref:mitochondrial import receptor subunit TOM20 homolog B-like n=1 Tax=Onthophagus taurus TaxID=166361 RepID=UPI0039BE6A48